MSTPSEGGILFLCVANSARSQLAEALARQAAPAGVEIFSAGAAPSRVHPFAVRVLQEAGIDSSRLYSKTVEDVPATRVRTVITLCDEQVCPSFPGQVERLHWPLPDPAGEGGSDAEVLDAFRRTRDRLRNLVEELFREQR